MSATGLLYAVAPPVVIIGIGSLAALELEGLGLPIGMEHLTGGLLAYLIIREVLKDRREKRAAAEPDRRLAEQIQMVAYMRESTELLRQIKDDQKEIAQVTSNFREQGGCPWMDADKSRGLIEAVGRSGKSHH